MPVAELIDDEEAIDLSLGLPEGFEMLDGELVEMPDMGYKSSWVASRVFSQLDRYCELKRIGVATTAEASFQCFPHQPGNVRKPDVAVVLCDPATFVPPDPHCEQVPALVVEVVSPNETAFKLDDKIDDFLKAGTRIVWVINPIKRRVVIHYPDLTTRQIGDTGTLDGEDVLPGFTLPLASILPPKSAT